MTKVVLITGASSGMGEMTARFLHENGYTVYAGTRDKNLATPTISGVNNIYLDVTDTNSMEAAVSEIMAKESKIDVLVNNAGYGLVSSAEEATDEEIFKQFDVNVFGLMIAHFINTRLVSRMGSRKMLYSGVALSVLAATSLLIAYVFSLSLMYYVLSVLPLMASLSMISVNADALVLQEFAEHAGTATAVNGTLRFGIGALAGPILALFYDGSTLPFVLLMVVPVYLVLICQLLQNKRNKAIV